MKTHSHFASIASAIAAIVLIAGCVAITRSADSLSQLYKRPNSEWPPATIDEGVFAEEIDALPPLVDVTWYSKEREDLGKALFFDPRLSGSGQIACASCHDPNLGWTDGKRFSPGHDRNLGHRNAMTLLNAAYFELLFWDGRAEGLIDLMLRPIQSEVEMNADLDAVILKLNEIEGYRIRFLDSFGSEEITRENLAISLASFVRNRVSSKSRFDRFVLGEYRVLNEEEIEGLHLFRTKARCMNCHNGPLFSDGQFHHTGLSYFGRRFEDLGRYEVTNDYNDRGKFRTPTLRDLPSTGPWMHNGLFTNFKGILRMYNHGITFDSRVQRRSNAPPLSPLIRPLDMTKEEITSLEAFLITLSRIPRFIEPPPLPGRDVLAQDAVQDLQ